MSLTTGFQPVRLTSPTLRYTRQKTTPFSEPRFGFGPPQYPSGKKIAGYIAAFGILAASIGGFVGYLISQNQPTPEQQKQQLKQQLEKLESQK